MHARVSFVAGTAEDAERGVSSFRGNVLPFIKQTGGRGALLLIDRETGRGMSITLWPDEETMRASEERANELRRQAAKEMGGSPEEARVERYEVAVLEV